MTARLTLLCHAPLDGEAGDIRLPLFPRVETRLDREGDALTALLAPLMAPLLAAPAARSWETVLWGPERRTHDTAAAVAGLIPGAGPVRRRAEPVLRDLDLGAWRGQTLASVATADPDAASAWLTDPDAAPHGGESLGALRHRVGAWLDGWDEGSAPPGGGVLAVTHPAVIRAAIAHVLGAPPAAFWRIDVTPLTSADLRRHARRWTLRALDPDPWTPAHPAEPDPQSAVPAPSTTR